MTPTCGCTAGLGARDCHLDRYGDSGLACANGFIQSECTCRCHAEAHLQRIAFALEHLAGEAMHAQEIPDQRLAARRERIATAVLGHVVIATRSEVFAVTNSSEGITSGFVQLSVQLADALIAELDKPRG